MGLFYKQKVKKSQILSCFIILITPTQLLPFLDTLQVAKKNNSFYYLFEVFPIPLEYLGQFKHEESPFYLCDTWCCGNSMSVYQIPLCRKNQKTKELGLSIHLRDQDVEDTSKKGTHKNENRDALSSKELKVL